MKGLSVCMVFNLKNSYFITEKEINHHYKHVNHGFPTLS